MWVFWACMEKEVPAGRGLGRRSRMHAAGWDRHAAHAIRADQQRANDSGVSTCLGAGTLAFLLAPCSVQVQSTISFSSHLNLIRSCVCVTGCLHVHGSRGWLLAAGCWHDLMVIRSWPGLWTLNVWTRRETNTDTDTAWPSQESDGDE